MIKFILIVIGIFVYILIGTILSYVFQGNVNSEVKVTDDDLNGIYVLLWPIVSVMLSIILLIFIVIEVINKIFKTNIEL